MRNTLKMTTKLRELPLSIQIKPKTIADREKINYGFAKLASKDSSFRLTTDTNSDQTTIQCIDEFRLSQLLGRLVDEFLVEAEIGAPRVFYHQTDKELLEPIIKIHVETPEEYTSVILSDLRSRRGVILDQDTLGKKTNIDAFVPLANTFGYINSLLSMSSGHANYTLQFDHYAACPTDNNPDDQPPSTIALRA